MEEKEQGGSRTTTTPTARDPVYAFRNRSAITTPMRFRKEEVRLCILAKETIIVSASMHGSVFGKHVKGGSHASTQAFSRLCHVEGLWQLVRRECRTSALSLRTLDTSVLVPLCMSP